MDDNGELEVSEHTEAEAAAEVDYAVKKQLIIRQLFAYSAVIGVFSLLVAEGSALEFVIGLPLLVLTISWCYSDAAERDHRIGFVMRLSLVFLTFIGLPIYLLQTRGFGGFKAIGASHLMEF